MLEGAPDYRHLRVIQGKDAAGDLQIIALDPSGRIIMLAYGWDGTTFIPQLVDELGRIVASIQGSIYGTWGIQGWWKYLIAEGTAIQDHSEAANHGTAYSGDTPAATYVEGKVVDAISLDGIDDHIEIPIIELTNQLTFETWVYFIDGQPLGDYGGLVSNLNGYDDSNKIIIKATEITVKLMISASEYTHQKTGLPTILNGWHHVVVVYNGVLIKFYLDGEEVYSAGRVGNLDSGATLPTLGLGSLVMPGELTMVGWWKIISTEGTAIVDHSDESNDGTAYSGGTPHADYVAGKVDDAIDLDGGNDFIEVAAHATINNLTEFSWEFWIYPHDVGGGITPLTKKYKWLHFNATRHIHASLATTGTTATSISNETVSLNDWHHIIVTYSESGDRKLHIYLDGEEVSYSAQIAATGTQSSDSGNPLRFGCQWNDTQYVDGLMDEIRIYDEALTLTHVAWLYEHPGEEYEEDPIHHLKGYLDETRIYAQALTAEQVAWRFANPTIDYQRIAQEIGVDSQGRMEVNVLDLPYKDTVMISEYVNDHAAGTVKLESDAVGEGKLWVITNAIARCMLDDSGATDIYIRRGDNYYMIAELVRTVAYDTLSFNGHIYLKAGDKLVCWFSAVDQDKSCQLYANGYSLDAT